MSSYIVDKLHLMTPMDFLADIYPFLWCSSFLCDKKRRLWKLITFDLSLVSFIVEKKLLVPSSPPFVGFPPSSLWPLPCKTPLSKKLTYRVCWEVGHKLVPHHSRGIDDLCCMFLYFLNEKIIPIFQLTLQGTIYWREHAAFQRLAFGRSTAGNYVVN